MQKQTKKDEHTKKTANLHLILNVDYATEVFWIRDYVHFRK